MAYETIVVNKPTDRWLGGLSTDTKPILDPRDRLHRLVELDTGNEYTWMGTWWRSDVIAGARNIHDAHVHHFPVNDFFHLHTGVDTTFGLAALAQERQITVANPTGWAVGDRMQLERADGSFRAQTHPTVVNILGSVFTLDAPLDNAWVTGDKIEQIVDNAAVAGSAATPISFKAFPNPGEIWHIQSFVINMTHLGQPDDSLFGDQAALQNGCLLRAYNGTADQYGTFTNWKTNGDIKLDMLDVVYAQKAGGGNWGVTGDGAIHARSGAQPELAHANGDFLELLIQDTILADTLHLKIQGHIEGR